MWGGSSDPLRQRERGESGSTNSRPTLSITDPSKRFWVPLLPILKHTVCSTAHLAGQSEGLEFLTSK